MKEYRATTTIHASPDTIWQILTDAPRYPEWEPNVTQIEGTIAPGEKITVHTKISPDRAFPVKVTEFVPGQKMVWSSGMPLGLFKGERSFVLTPQDNSAVRVTVHEVFSGLLLPLIGRTIPDLSESFEQFVAGLKSRAENGGQ